MRCRPLLRLLWLTAVVLLASALLAASPAQALPDQRIGYGFEAGAGTAVANSSASGGPGTAIDPTWTTAGRYGNAITFDGSSTRVRSAGELTLGGAFTLEAWVNNPSAQTYETILTVGTDRDLYLFDGTLNFYTGAQNLAFGPALGTGTWQHVALVSDGSTVRAYVDGVQRGTARDLALGSTTGSLQVGAWIDGGNDYDLFSGTLDEVRVYDRALSAAEVVTDRDTPVVADTPGGGGPDTTAPALSAARPSGALPAGTTQSALQVTTDEPATCRYSTTPGTAYAAMPDTFATTGGTAHSTPVTDLVDGGSYAYRVRCQDAAGNPTTTDFPITFSVAATAADSQLGPWTTTAALPTGRSGTGAVAANGYMYLVGGLSSSGAVVDTVDVAAIGPDGTLGAWTTTTALPRPVRGVRPVYWNGYLYVAGGSDGGEYSSEVYFAPVEDDGSLGAWRETTDLPQAQLSHSTVAADGYLYVIGGNPGTCIPTVRSAPIGADGRLGGWSTTTPLPAARCGIVESAAVAGGRIYVAAGYDNNDVTDRVHYATIGAGGTLGAWQTSPSTLLAAREYTALEAVGGYLFVLGGQTELFGGVTAAVEQAEINADGSLGAFSAATPLPGPRGYLASEAVDGRVYVLGGGTGISGGAPQSTVHVATGPGGGGGGDSTPPARSAGEPAGTLAAGTTQVTLRLTTDEPATCRYGTTPGTAYAALPTAFATTGGTAHSDAVTGLTAGTRTFHVRCRDTAGNANSSDFAITFAVPAAGGGGIPGLRVGYDLDAGTGTAVTDSSPNATTATATAPGWTAAGRYGGAITFNGTSSRVRSDTDVALGAASTVQAWVNNPSAQAYETLVALGPTRDVHLAYGVLSVWDGSRNLAFGPALAAGTWQHVAIVSDGTTVRAYVDGVQRGAAQTYALAPVSAPLQIGAWNETATADSDFFSGTIDEVRVHDRALTPAEIATDRDTALGTALG